MYQNGANPFSTETTIGYYLPEWLSGDAHLVVYDITGKPVKQYELKNSGNGSVKVDAAGLSPGVYLYSLNVKGMNVSTRRMLLVQ